MNSLVLDNPRYQAGEAASKAAAAAAAAPAQRGLFGPEGFTFGDFLDIINPLQHIPIVATVYRAITGDKIEPGARIAGDTLYGGPIGLAASLVNAMVQESTGKDIGEQALAMVGIDVGSSRPDGGGPALADVPPAAVEATARSAEAQQAAAQQVAAQQVVAQQAAARPALKMTVGRAPESVADKSKVRSGEIAEPGQVEVPPESAAAVDADRRAMAEDLAEQRAASRRAVQQMLAEQQIASARTATVVPAAGQGGTDPSAILAAAARHTQPGARSIAAKGPAPAAPQQADGRLWFPAFPQGGGGAPVRAVGTQPVTQQAVTSKFGSARAQQAGSPSAGQSDAAETAAAPAGATSEWAERAAAAYQKYFDMQQQTDRSRAQETRAFDQVH